MCPVLQAKAGNMNCYCSVKGNMKSFKLKEIEVKLAKKSLNVRKDRVYVTLKIFIGKLNLFVLLFGISL